MLATSVKHVIGKPWRNGARGPEAFDCWGLVHWLYQENLGIRLEPYATLDASSVLAVQRVFAGERERWEPVQRPPWHDMDVVALSMHRRIHHVGVWSAEHRRVLHCVEGGCVVAQPLFALRALYQTIHFYRLK